MSEDTPKIEAKSASPSALQQSRAVAQALATTARKLRFSTSNRSRLYKAVGLRPKLADRLFRAAAIALTIFVFVVPNVASLMYFGLIASDQYQSEARFTVRASTPALGKDQLGKVTGIPSAKIVQDTQIVTNYVVSRAMLEALDAQLNVRALYSKPEIDQIARLPVDVTYEEFLDYWKRMVTTTVSASSGIVTVKVKAFSGEDAQTILRAVIGASERVINDLNSRIWRDVVATAQSSLDRASENLQSVRERIATEQNSSGVFTVEGTSEILSHLLTTVQGEKLTLEEAYSSKLESMSQNSPQMKVLAREIASKENQIEDLKRQLAGQGGAGTRNLADVSVEFTKLQLERQLAEQQFASSMRTFEQVQFVSRQQLMYLDAFLAPSLPDDAQYPKRLFWIVCVFGISLVAWAGSIGLISIARTKLS
ncbi:capsule biosynthesis protein [Ensifer sp. ENS03]|uniref:capsule biosynthesis protein n=1 Tax=Ensifer sp. ENS03 TaxID=2769283 RepID=UPI00177A9274|nr:capsule biosynthesis protein [Ensifer sp. ENS03]MBD9559594.1 capsule biosynthesis protein [Ensifer sp. ENS03]